MKELPSFKSFFKLLKEKQKTVAVTAGTVLAALSVAIGTTIVPSNFEVPVLLANGEIITPPWYVTVEGSNVALVDSKQEAKEVVKKVKNAYKNEKTVDVEIEEKTSPKEMPIKSGDKKPKILTVDEAVKQITAEKEMTVLATEVVTVKEPVKFEEIEKKTKDLYVGQTLIHTKGHNGSKKVTKEVTRENGKIIKSTVKEEVLLEKARKQITLTGTMELPEDLGSISRGGETRSTGQLAIPVSTLHVTSSFGPRWGSFHRGVDLGMPTGTPIHAADGGTVVFTGYSGSYGNIVKIDHGNGMMTYYAHCSVLLTEEGESVKKGQTIAEVGSTGNSTGPHLHFEVLVDGDNKNPMNYL